MYTTMMLLFIGIVSAVTTVTSESVDSVLNSTSVYNITANTTETVSSIVVKPKTAFTVNLNQTGGSWDLSGSTPRFYLRLKGNNFTETNTTILAYNGTTLLSRGNYTVAYIADNITHINFTTATYMNDNITFSYNRTFLTTESISGSSLCYTSASCLVNITGTDAAGETHYITLYNTSTSTSTILNSKPLDGKTYNISYTLSTYTADSSAKTACQGVQTTVFAGFALIAVALIVLSAFGIIAMFKGGSGEGTFMAIALGVVGLGVILMIGYIVINYASNATCALL